MKAEVLLELLESAAERAAVKVSYEALAASVGLGAGVGHGGLCRVKGQYRIIIDKRATPQERVATLASSLAAVISPDQRAAQPPKVRDALAFYAA